MDKKNKKFKTYEHKVVFDMPIYWKTKPTKKELEMVDKIMYGIVEAQKQHQADYMGVDIDTMRIEQTPCICSLHPFRDGYLIKTATYLIFTIVNERFGDIYVRKLKDEDKDD